MVHDVAVQKLPVRFAIDRAGLVGADGATHAGAFDIAYLACLPNMVVMAAADEAELMHMVATCAAYDGGPIALRYPRGEGAGVALPERGEPLSIGKGRILREGSRIAILTLGARLAEGLKAAEELAARGLSTTVADARFAKPLDRDLILRLAAEHELLITVEEGARGGFGAHVLTLLSDEGALDNGLKVRTMTLPDVFQDQDKPERMYAAAGLDAKGIVAKALAALGNIETPSSLIRVATQRPIRRKNPPGRTGPPSPPSSRSSSWRSSAIGRSAPSIGNGNLPLPRRRATGLPGAGQLREVRQEGGENSVRLRPRNQEMRMDARLKTIAETCLEGAESGAMTFPQIVGTLMREGFDGYSVDFRRGTATYYLSDGDSVDLPTRRTAVPIAAAFDAAAVQAAIREAQQLVPGYTYSGFCKKVMTAGCAGYVVSFPGRRVLYYGRDAETHVERFPPQS